MNGNKQKPGSGIGKKMTGVNSPVIWIGVN